MIKIAKTAMILAAGLGKRLVAITQNTPKPLVTIGNTCCLEITLNALKAAGFNRVIINTHYLSEQINDYVKRFNDLEIILSYEPELLETAGGIRKVLSEFDGLPFVVVNADMYWRDSDTSIIKQMAMEMRDEDDFCLSVTPLSNAQGHLGHGDFVLNEGLLQKPSNKTSHQKEDVYVYTGVQLINPRVIAPLPIAPLSLQSLYFKAAETKHLKGVIFNGLWIDVGNLTGLNLARNQQNFY